MLLFFPVLTIYLDLLSNLSVFVIKLASIVVLRQILEEDTVIIDKSCLLYNKNTLCKRVYPKYSSKESKNFHKIKTNSKKNQNDQCIYIYKFISLGIETDSVSPVPSCPRPLNPATNI